MPKNDKHDNRINLTHYVLMLQKGKRSTLPTAWNFNLWIRVPSIKG